MKNKLTLLPLVLVAAPLFGGNEDGKELTAWQMTDPIAELHKKDLEWIDPKTAGQATLVNGTILSAGLMAYDAQDHASATRAKELITQLDDTSRPLARGLDDERLYAATPNSTHETFDKMLAAAHELAASNSDAITASNKVIKTKKGEIAYDKKNAHSAKLHNTQAAAEKAEAKFRALEKQHAEEKNMHRKAELECQLGPARKAFLQARTTAVAAVVAAKKAEHIKPALKEIKTTHEFKYAEEEQPVVEGPEPENAPSVEQEKKPTYKEKRDLRTKKVTAYEPVCTEITIDGEQRVVALSEGTVPARLEKYAEVKALEEEVAERKDAIELAGFLKTSAQTARADVLMKEIEAEKAHIKALEKFAEQQAISYNALTTQHAEKVTTVTKLPAPAEGKKGNKARKTLKQATTARDRIKNEMGTLATQMKKKEAELTAAKKNLARLQAAQNPSSGLLGLNTGWGLLKPPKTILAGLRPSFFYSFSFEGNGAMRKYLLN